MKWKVGYFRVGGGKKPPEFCPKCKEGRLEELSKGKDSELGDLFWGCTNCMSVFHLPLAS